MIELLVVLVIVAILIAIAVPAYLVLRGRSADRAAQAELREAVPSAEAFASDNTGTSTDADRNKNTTGYKGMTANILRQSYDPALSGRITVVTGKTTATQYCLSDTVGGETWSVLGPASVTSYKKSANCT